MEGLGRCEASGNHAFMSAWGVLHLTGVENLSALEKQEIAHVPNVHIAYHSCRADSQETGITSATSILQWFTANPSCFPLQREERIRQFKRVIKGSATSTYFYALTGRWRVSSRGRRHGQPYFTIITRWLAT